MSLIVRPPCGPVLILAMTTTPPILDTVRCMLIITGIEYKFYKVSCQLVITTTIESVRFLV